MTDDGYELDPKFIAGVDMARRTGSIEFQLRYSDDAEPTVWVAVATHNIGVNGLPAPPAEPGEITHTAAGGLTPLSAVLRLCDQLIDGGQCAHCGKPSAFDHGTASALPPALCWTQWDPELKTYRRNCEGDT